MPPPQPDGRGGASEALIPQPSFLEGMLEAADGRCRITPAIGPPTVVSYTADKADNVLEAMHKPVRVKLDATARKVVDIEVTARDLDQAGFFARKTIDELIAEQRIQAITNLESLAGAIPDEDVDDMVAGIYRDRELQE